MLPVEQVKKMSVSEVPPPLLDLSEERVPNKEAIHSREAKGTMLTEKAGFFPPVEKLDLRERRRSAEPPEDWPSEEEIRRFWKLRQEIVESQQAEVLERQRLPAELPPALTAVLSDKEKRRPRPRPVFRTRTPSFKSVLPELAPWQQAQGRTSLPEESISPDGAAQEVASKIPFATDLIGNEKIPMHSPGKLKQSKEKSLQASQEMSAFREENLEEKRKQHSQQLQGRRSRF